MTPERSRPGEDATEPAGRGIERENLATLRHVRSLDVGFVREHGEIVSAANVVEFFQLVEKAEGTLYWLDLAHMLSAEARDLDRGRVQALARFLAEAFRALVIAHPRWYPDLADASRVALLHFADRISAPRASSRRTSWTSGVKAARGGSLRQMWQIRPATG